MRTPFMTDSVVAAYIDNETVSIVVNAGPKEFTYPYGHPKGS